MGRVLARARSLSRYEDVSGWSAPVALAVAIAVAVAFAGWLLSVWPTDYMYDDGAIVLRYMDNFATGHPFRYNPEGPAVFGISGFVHAAFAGALAASRLLTPEASLLASGFVGVLLTTLAVLLILARFSRSATEIAAAAAYTIASCHYFLTNAFQGLESSLHAGIVLFAVWAFLAGRWRSMWLLCALSVISKLDALPVVLLLVLLRAASLRTREAWKSELGRALLWGGVPVLGWVLFTASYFGSPLPQSAMAKVEFHEHSPSRTGFVLQWWLREEKTIAVYWGLALLATLIPAARRRADGSKAFVLPAASAAVLLLYMVYNPGERMPWYYVLPQLLLVVGGVAGALTLARRVPRRLGTLVVVGAALVLVPHAVEIARHHGRAVLAYIHSVEPERAAIGEYVHANAEPSDRLVTGHGYPARHARIHTHDLSGLNSPEVTDLRREGRDPILALAADWVAYPGMIPFATQREVDYRLERVFYDRSARGAPAWRVWRRAPGPKVTPVNADEVAAGDSKATTPEIESAWGTTPVIPGRVRVRFERAVALTYTRPHPVVGLCFGVARSESGVAIRVVAAGAVLGEFSVAARDADRVVDGLSEGFRLAFDPDLPMPVGIEITDAEGRPVAGGAELLEPVWLIEPREEP